MLLELAVLGGAAVLTAFLTWIVRKQALARGMLDVPNERSSHVVPMPRGGGVGFVLTLVAGMVALACAGLLGYFQLVTLLPGAMVVAAVGYMDDKQGLTPRTRFSAHVAAALIAVLAISLSHTDLEIFPLVPSWLALALVTIGTVWSVNLFNFMDGIDGIAVSQAIFVAGATAGLLALTSGPESWILLCVLTAGACTGFLAWNWPPAKIFMGDVGSGFLGFWLAIIALNLHVSGALSIWSSIILGMIFIADTTATLIRRVLAGEKWYMAHRSHAYQHVARRFGRHMPVVLIVWSVNLTVALPAAYFAHVDQKSGPWVAIAFFIVLSAGCLMCGAGQSDRQAVNSSDTAASYGA